MNKSEDSGYGLSSVPPTEFTEAPSLDYLPPQPKNYRPPIGLIGAGGISEYHLRAYQAMGLDVVAICDIDVDRAEARRAAFFPRAKVFQDYKEVLQQTDIEVMDVATHAEIRVPIVEAALRMGKHVLSQKPFVTDLDVGRRLIALAKANHVHLAINQNGRWAPHFSYLRQAVANGLLGTVSSVDFSLQWDHTWTIATHFNEMHHLILFDFAIHWFDMANAIMANRNPEQIYASVRRAAGQKGKPPFLAHVVIDYADAQVRMTFNANVTYGQEDRTIMVGDTGTGRASGPGLNDQRVELWLESGHAQPKLVGNWFDNGFRGTMGELLCAIEENRSPANRAQDNLRSLELCFAALTSADTGSPVRPGSVGRLPDSAQAKPLE